VLTDLSLASEKRKEELLLDDIDSRLDLLLANYQRVTANPRSMGYLRFLLRYYAKQPHIFRKCYADNLKRWGPERTKGLCAVVKDTIRQNTHWRHGPPKGEHAKSAPFDVGAPGVAIAYADKGAANPPWHGGNDHLSESTLDMGDMAVPEDICLILEDIGKQCDPYRVIVGLDSAPHPSAELEELIL
jgi:hypothetical protein